MPGLLERVEHLLVALADPWVQDGFELPAPLGRREHDLAHLLAIQLALVVEHLRAERLDDVAEPTAARRHDHARELVGRHDGDAVLLE